MSIEKNFPSINFTMQALADLGYPKEIRQSLDQELVKKIISQNIRFETYAKQLQEENSQFQDKSNKEVSEEFKQKYKRAYEDLLSIQETIGIIDDLQRNTVFKEVLRLGGQAKQISEIEDFIQKNEEYLSDEEITFLNIKKEWIRLIS